MRHDSMLLGSQIPIFERRGVSRCIFRGPIDPPSSQPGHLCLSQFDRQSTASSYPITMPPLKPNPISGSLCGSNRSSHDFYIYECSHCTYRYQRRVRSPRPTTCLLCAESLSTAKRTGMYKAKAGCWACGRKRVICDCRAKACPCRLGEFEVSRLMWKIVVRTEIEPGKFVSPRVMDLDEFEMEIGGYNRKLWERRSGVKACVDVN